MSDKFSDFPNLPSGISDTLPGELDGRFDVLQDGVNAALRMTGLYDDGYSYKINDVATIDGVYWRAKTANVMSTPAVGDTWELIGGGTGADASTTVKGIVKLSVAPASATAPIALGANDPAVTNSRTPTAHHATHSTSGSDAIAPADIGAATATGLTAVSDALDDHLADDDAHPQYLRADGATVATADIDAGGKAVTNLANPTSGTDAVNKTYADAIAGGFKFKNAVQVTTVGNIGTLSGLLTIDGVTLNEGDRVLVKDQTTPVQNGIYTASSGAWSRAADADEPTELDAGTQVYVKYGTSFSKTSWVLLTPSVTPGTTAQEWTQGTSTGGGEANTTSSVGSGAGTFTAGKTGISLLFRRLKALSTKLTVGTTGDDVTIDVVEANLNLANIGGTLGLAQLATAAKRYDVAASTVGKPDASAVIARFKSPVAFTVSATGHQGVAGVAATALTVFTMRKNGTSIGTATFAASGTVPTFAVTSTAFAIGDILTITAPSAADATLADIALTLAGSL